MRRLLFIWFLSLAILLAPGFTRSASATPSPKDLEFTGYAGQSIAEAISARSAVDPQYREDSIAWMGANQSSGLEGDEFNKLHLSPSMVRGMVDQLRGLRSIEGSADRGAGPSSPTSRRDADVPSASPPAGAPSMRASAVWGDPNSWNVVGNAQGDRSYWKSDGDLGIFRGVCSNGKCTTTDQIEIRFTVTPTKKRTVSGGSLGSRVEGYLRYFPSSGRYSGIHIDTWGITSGSVMYKSSAGTVDLPIGSTKRAYAKNDRDLSGKRLTVAVQLWAKLNGQWKWDAGKTADCIGRWGTDVRCFY